jgi:hypothetical protein
MDEHGSDHGHGHEEDPFVCIKVGAFFVAVLAMIIVIGMLH